MRAERPPAASAASVLPADPVALPTVSDVLEMPEVRRGHPKVVAGHARLGNPVRWVHVSELADIAPLLRGGELVLTTGIGLPERAEALGAYLTGLAEVGAAGLMVELGRRYVDRLPAALVAAATDHELPLVELHRETRYVRVTEAVHSRILDAQLEELRASAQLHEAFTALSTEGASIPDIVRESARIAGRPVILENLAHRVLAADTAGRDAPDLLAGWEEHSRAIRLVHRTGYAPTTGWLLTIVATRGQDWGRLILLCDDEPSAQDRVLLERAATTIALAKLLERDDSGLERQTHRLLLAGLLDQPPHDPGELAARMHAAGVPLTGRQLVGAAVRLVATGSTDEGRGAHELREFADAAVHAARSLGGEALAGVLDAAEVGVLLSWPRRADVDAATEEWAAEVRRMLQGARTAVFAAGSQATDMGAARRSLLEARQVVAAAAHRPVQLGGCHRLADVGLRGLLALLRTDARLQTFVERQLGAVLSHDSAQGTDLLAVLQAFFDAGGTKSAAAGRMHMSRTAYYERLDRLQRLLGVDLSDPDTQVSLHAALLAREEIRDLGGPH